MQIVRLEVTNFLSFKNIDYKFEEKPILIQGENLTDDSQESNGSGKSAIQAAIEFALFKTTSRKVRDIELVFFGENIADVKLTLFCPIRNQNLLIERRIKVKGSGESQLSINGIVKYSFEDKMVTEIDKFINEWIGISKEDLQNYYIINKERYKSFFSSSNKEKIEMINRFSNAKLINGVDKVVQEDVDKLEGELKGYESLKTSAISKIKTLKEQIYLELNRDLKKELEEEIEIKRGKIKDIEQQIKNESDIKKLYVEDSLPKLRNDKSIILKEIREKRVSLETINSSLDKLKDISFADKYSEIDKEIMVFKNDQDKKKSERKTFLSSKEEVEDIINEINKNIKGAVKCPKCNHEFIVGDTTIDIESERQALLETEETLKEIDKSLLAIKSSLNDLDSKMDSLGTKKSEIEKDEDKLLKERRQLRSDIENIESNVRDLNRKLDLNESFISKKEKEISDIDEKIKSLMGKIETINEEINSSKEKEIDHNRINQIKEQMRGEGERLRNINASIRKKKIIIFETSKWIYNFKSFNMYLANQLLKVIQGYCNKFLQDINSDLQIRWEGIKMLANGSLKEEITAYILRNLNERDFWSFSGGERARLDYSMILTLQRMINSTHKYGGLDFLSTDEVCEGLDPLGLSDLMKSLSNLNKTIMITTHVVNRNISDKILLVKKINGVSTITKGN